MAAEKMYYPDEEYEDANLEGYPLMPRKEVHEWYADELTDEDPCDTHGDAYPVDDWDDADWRDEDIMDTPPKRERRAS